jgi:hypothetical protein
MFLLRVHSFYSVFGWKHCVASGVMFYSVRFDYVTEVQIQNLCVWNGSDKFHC